MHRVCAEVAAACTEHVLKPLWRILSARPSSVFIMWKKYLSLTSSEILKDPLFYEKSFLNYLKGNQKEDLKQKIITYLTQNLALKYTEYEQKPPQPPQFWLYPQSCFPKNIHLSIGNNN